MEGWSTGGWASSRSPWLRSSGAAPRARRGRPRTRNEPHAASRARAPRTEARPARAPPGRDVWGEALVSAPGGPTYDRAAGSSRRCSSPAARARLPSRPPASTTCPSRSLAAPRAPSRSRSTSPTAARSCRADGGPSAHRRPAARERYGSCLARLATPRLADGWLPILQTRYVDAAGRPLPAGVVRGPHRPGRPARRASSGWRSTRGRAAAPRSASRVGRCPRPSRRGDDRGRSPSPGPHARAGLAARRRRRRLRRGRARRRRVLGAPPRRRR